MPETLPVLISVRTEARLFSAGIGLKQLEFGVSGNALAELPPGEHPLHVQAAGAAGTRVHIKVTGSVLTPLDEALTIPEEGNLFYSYEFTVGEPERRRPPPDPGFPGVLE